jgi:hypothetical protein
MATPQFKNTDFGKAVRTLNQAFIVIAPLFLGIVALPEVQTYIASNITWLLPLLAPSIAIVTYLYNKYGK